MFVTAAITLVCTAGVSFYVRFLVALCKECSLHRIGYWVRLRLNTAKRRSLGGRSGQSQWLALPENGLNSDCSSSRRVRRKGFNVDRRSIRRTIGRTFPPL